MGDLIGNKIASKTLSVSKKSMLIAMLIVDPNSEMEAGRASLKDIPKKRYISLEERQQTIDELRLV